ncbi:MAG: YcxB family protein [Lachnospiraceae bacterium]|mgnify:FL=1|nr:YcxB family protein [Lachnospiraceae bacterium]
MGKKYEYVMEEAEIRECGLFLTWEYVKCNKRTWLLLLVILTAELILGPTYIVATALLSMVLILIMCINCYRLTTRALRGQPVSIWIEGNRLKARRRDYSEIPCTDIQMIRRTKRLLFMGYTQGDKRQAWYVIPLRCFAGEQEVERFLAMLHGSYGQEQNPCQEHNTDRQAQQEDIRLSFQMDGESWGRLQKGAADLGNSGSMGRPARFKGMMLWVCAVTVFVLIATGLAVKKIDLPIVCFDVALTAWMGVWLFYRNPEKRIRKQLKAPQMPASVCGLWQFSFTNEGICVDMPQDRKSIYQWQSLSWLFETQEAFYFFHQDRKRFIAIPKKSFVTREQVEIFYRLCADHGIQRMAAKKARYVPGWFLWIIFGLIFLAFFGTAAVKISLNTGSVPGNVSERRYERVALEKQVEVLASLGLSVPKEAEESVRNSMEEYGLYDLVEESPYIWLLTNMGAPTHDEDWNVTGYAEDVFWFDFEGFDISTDYIDVLNGMRALAKGSCLDDVTDLQEDMTEADWENGKGVITVSLTRKGQTYSYVMDMYYDWIDTKVLGIFNPLLEQEGSQKYFYATGDDGQGAIVFFCTEDWAKEFTEKTGLVLEKEITKADKVR